ncbi:hypothetical protein PAXINDRAFT_22448 [Paxillus involutus ATCC 200175]|uniref:Uncharacterized protein n=1 Tax=Paxillus involutus ATCC 200175 TaxID=664439 RepID=A0A0C9SS61_PAXIN|nr:hypothetical protein PAXINDRAFT_22448 [Paxillus involutus ATCC 200175]
MANYTIPCPVCHKNVDRDRIRNHARQHAIADAMAQTYWQDPVAPYHQFTPPEVTPPPSPALSPVDPHPPASPPLPVQKRHEPNAFTIWFQDNAHDSLQYTRIDGQKSGPGLQKSQSIQAARALRESTKSQVARIVREFEGLSDNDKETCLGMVRDVPILPGLVAYTFTHLNRCPRRGWITKDDWSMELSDLKERVQRWKKYGDTACILGYKTIRSDLVDILRGTKVLPDKHKCNTQLLDGTMLLEHDILNLAAVAALCVTGPEKNRILTVVNLYEANLSIDLFHALLEKDLELEDWYQRCLFNTVVTLSKETSYCPTSLYLSEGAVRDLTSQDRGGFGVVYAGKFGSRMVAVKVLKQESYKDSNDFNKVRIDLSRGWRVGFID